MMPPTASHKAGIAGQVYLLGLGIFSCCYQCLPLARLGLSTVHTTLLPPPFSQDLPPFSVHPHCPPGFQTRSAKPVVEVIHSTQRSPGSGERSFCRERSRSCTSLDESSLPFLVGSLDWDSQSDSGLAVGQANRSLHGLGTAQRRNV